MDHSDDSQVVKLFERIKSENDGKLDVCVNNAYAGKENFYQMFRHLALDKNDSKILLIRQKNNRCQIVLFQLKKYLYFWFLIFVLISVENCRMLPTK